MKTFTIVIIPIIITGIFFCIPGASVSQTTFKKHVLTTSFYQGSEVHACDIDQDGDMDFLATGNNSGGQVSWWENNGYIDFIEHVVDDDLNRARSVGTGDLNEDGEIDVVAAGWTANTVRWYENDGNENWTLHDIDNQFIGAHTVDIKDVNDDGRMDVLCSSFDNSPAFSEIAWWENMPDTNWTKHVISTRFQQSPYIYGEDIDKDGDMDILACGEANGEVCWWENDGSQNWTEHMIDSLFAMAHTVHARDIDLDGDFDIIGAACMSSTLAWWENDGSQHFTRHPMGSLNGALWFDAVDLDNDGDRDLYAGGQTAQKLVRWENDGNSNFTPHLFNETFTQTFSVVHADFDLDTDTDLVAIGYNSSTIAWFENQLLGPQLYDKPEGSFFDAANNRYLVANVGDGSIVITDTTNNAQSYFTYGHEDIYGMCIIGDVLYTSDGDTVFGFDLETAEIVFELEIPPLNNLDGMTTDGNGFLYVIDTGGRLIKVDIEDQSYEVLVSSGLPNYPQDCVYDPFRGMVVVAAYQHSAPIIGVDPETGQLTTLLNISKGRYDGVTIDQTGNFYLSSHIEGGKVFRYPHDFLGEPETIASGLGQPAGLYYNQQDNVLVVPSFSQDTVYFYKISTTGINDFQQGENLQLDISPNPCKRSTKLKIKGLEGNHGFILTIRDQAGRIQQDQALKISGEEEIIFDLGNLSHGVYLVTIEGSDVVLTDKIIVQ
jgi:sugar lactone lactonase YvrE